jgi:hypothetical protein
MGNDTQAAGQSQSLPAEDAAQFVEIVGDTFAMIPSRLLRDPAIGSSAVRLYGLLLDRGQTPDRCFPGHAWLAEQMGVSPRSVPRMVRELQQAGWVERVERFGPGGRQLTNGYRVLRDPRTSAGGEPPLPRAPERALGRAPERAPGYAPVRALERDQEELDPSNQTQTRAQQPSLEGIETATKTEERFERFWGEYPSRPNGAKGSKKRAKTQWLKLKPSDHVAAWRALPSYAARCNGYPKDAERWLRDRLWEDEEVSAPPRREESPYARAERERVERECVAVPAAFRRHA